MHRLGAGRYKGGHGRQPVLVRAHHGHLGRRHAGQLETSPRAPSPWTIVRGAPPDVSKSPPTRTAGRSADAAALAKLYTKAFFAGGARQATFMAQLGEASPASAVTRAYPCVRSPTAGPLDAARCVTAAVRAAVAGVIRCSPSSSSWRARPNSYRRFGPGNWAPVHRHVGTGNYSCRCGSSRRSRSAARAAGPRRRREPHQCLAMFLGAAVGHRARLEPPPPVIAPPTGSGRESGALPRDLVEAAERFGASRARDCSARLRRALRRLPAGQGRACRRFVSVQEQRATSTRCEEHRDA